MLIKKITQLMSLALLVKIVGFFRELVLAYYYGESMIVDVYLVSMNIPSVLFTLFGMAISTCFIPIYLEIKSKNGNDNALIFTNNLLNSLLCMAAILAITGIIFPQIFVKIFASGFSGEAYLICKRFIRITMITIILVVIIHMFNAYLQVHNRFNQNSGMVLPNNIILILSVATSFYLKNIYILPVGVVVGAISQIIYLSLLIRKTDYKYSFHIDLKDETIHKVLVLIGPVFLGTAVNQLNIIVDRTLASWLPAGSISALSYSSRINSIILDIVIASSTTVLYPLLTGLSAKEEQTKFKNYTIQFLKIIAMIVFPITMLLNYLSKDIISILFLRGAFGQEEVCITSQIFKIYSIGLIGYAFRDVINKIFYSLKDTKTPVKNSILAVILNILLNLFFVKRFKVAGLAMATTISSIFAVFLLLKDLKKKLNLQLDKNEKKDFLVLLLGFSISYITLVAVDFLIKNLTNSWLRCITLSGASLITYIIVLLIFKESDLRKLWRKLRKNG